MYKYVVVRPYAAPYWDDGVMCAYGVFDHIDDAQREARRVEGDVIPLNPPGTTDGTRTIEDIPDTYGYTAYHPHED